MAARACSQQQPTIDKQQLLLLWAALIRYSLILLLVARARSASRIMDAKSQALLILLLTDCRQTLHQPASKRPHPRHNSRTESPPDDPAPFFRRTINNPLILLLLLVLLRENRN